MNNQPNADHPFFKNLPCAIYIINMETFAVEWITSNKVLFDTTMFSGQEILDYGKTFTEDFIVKSDLELTMNQSREFLANGGDVWEGVYRIKDKNGNLNWVYYLLKAYERNENGEIVNMLVSAFPLVLETNTPEIFSEHIKRKKRERFSHKISLLSPREIDILECISEGLSQKEISARLFISQSTIETHKARLFKKLEVKSSQELVKIASEMGFLE